MNEVEQHETDKTCNACGSPVVAEWGRYRCRDHQCITNDRSNDLSWASDTDVIVAARNERKSYGRAG